jgi:uncharacterized protein (UPF0332 family)
LTPEVEEHLDKARECLLRAKIILGAGVGEDAGRDAYLAAFHAAQALILARSGKVVKTHRGVHRLFAQLAKNEARLREFSRFLSQAYNLKDIADYELGRRASVPLDRAADAIDTAERFVDHVAEILV